MVITYNMLINYEIKNKLRFTFTLFDVHKYMIVNDINYHFLRLTRIYRAFQIYLTNSKTFVLFINFYNIIFNKYNNNALQQ